MDQPLRIRSHVGRDILQSAQSFRTPEAAVWEYVVNALQYTDPGVNPRVDVLLDQRARTVVIADNGSGMDLDGLRHFFTMHGENQRRRLGVPGRGKFGTGKSAAFGIGTTLVVESVRDGVLQHVEVNRAMIEAADGAEVPVRFVAQDVPAPGRLNGTVVTITGVKVKLAREPVVSLVERHLTAFRSGSPVVTVNGRTCAINRVAAVSTRTFEAPDGLLDGVVLTVSTSQTALDPTHRGVTITVGEGNMVAVVTAGVDTKEYGNRLFGEVDVPALDDPRYDPVSAYGSNRDLMLNPAHPVASALIAFVGSSLETVRLALVAEGKQARADAEARRLALTTSEIEELLNRDLATMSDRLTALADVRRRSRLPAPAGGQESDAHTTTTTTDGAAGREDGVLGRHESTAQPVKDSVSGNGSGGGGAGGDLASPAASEEENGPDRITPAGGRGRQRPRGGLSVRTDHLGGDYDRADWDKDGRIITINLDHPVIVAARGVGDDEVAFRRLCHEIAFTQYAIALADLQLERDEAMTASDAMFEVRAALERVWANAASLYGR